MHAIWYKVSVNKEYSETLGKELVKPDGHPSGSKGRTDGRGNHPFPRHACGFLLQKRCTLLTAAPNAGCRILTHFSKVRSKVRSGGSEVIIPVPATPNSFPHWRDMRKGRLASGQVHLVRHTGDKCRHHDLLPKSFTRSNSPPGLCILFSSGAKEILRWKELLFYESCFGYPTFF